MSVDHMREASQRRVVLADWDNTLSAGFTQARWVEFLAARHLFSAVASVRELIAKFSTGSLTYEEFCEQAGKAYGVGLAGRLHSEIAAAARHFVQSDHSVFPFVAELWQLFEAEALQVIVISGAPAEVLHQHAAAFGFEVAGALQLEMQEDRYTGNVSGNMGLHKNKLAAVQRITSDRSVVIGMGDATSDLPLLQAASVPCIVLGSQTHSSPFVRGIVPLDPSRHPKKLVHQLRRALAVATPSRPTAT